MPSPTSIAPHPRLYLDAEAAARPEDPPARPFLKAQYDAVVEAADRYLAMGPIEYPRGGHNEHLLRARAMQTCIVTLLVRWRQTGEDRFRAAVMERLREMGGWSEWSWIAWRKGQTEPDAIFDLSYGENAATLAVAYDELHASLQPKEKKDMVAMARRWVFGPGLVHAKAKGGMWWYGHDSSNWNTVCAGGLGMLALAMYEDAPEAPEALRRAERSVRPFIKHLDETDGAWPEGIGYWNYGMRYAFMYLLSHERATGRKHPLLAVKGLVQTLAFPLDFCPNGQPCSFGDVNKWAPIPVHYAMARRLRQRTVLARLDRILERRGGATGAWPHPAEWLALHPGETDADAPAAETDVVRIYKGLDWALLADRMPDPRMAMTLRGGTTKVPHGHLDLLSFHCVVGGERLIENLSPDEYLDSTFSARRYDLFEMRPDAKNTLFINGVGVTEGSSLDRTERVSFPAGPGVRLVATSAMGATRDGSAAKFCGRLVVLLADGRGWLLVDRADLGHNGRFESRIHTRAAVETGAAGAELRGEAERLSVVYAANVPSVLVTARTAPTTPSAPPATVLRWCTEKLHKEMIFATLLAPGSKKASVRLDTAGKGYVATVRIGGWRQEVRLTRSLRPARR